uniref:Uncharacterized protein n=1 Tax=Spironucleus salmonicida TaxID=348837 RepID=V6LH80_9EUKA|eukprot:EST43653.1 Hypothetical protein SS50377_16696 [Spironucleus salmonicida]
MDLSLSQSWRSKRNEQNVTQSNDQLLKALNQANLEIQSLIQQIDALEHKMAQPVGIRAEEAERKLFLAQKRSKRQEGDIIALTQSHDRLRSEFLKLLELKNQLQKQLADGQIDVISVQKKTEYLGQIENQLVVLKQENNYLVAGKYQLEVQIPPLNKQIYQLTQEKAQLTEEVIQLEERVGVRQVEILQLKSQVSNLTSKNTILEQELLTSTTQLNKLQDNEQKIYFQLNQQNEHIEQSEAKLVQQSEEILRLRGLLTEKESLYNMKEKQIGMVRDHVKELKGEVQKYKEEIKNVKSNNLELQGVLQTQQVTNKNHLETLQMSKMMLTEYSVGIQYLESDLGKQKQYIKSLELEINKTSSAPITAVNDTNIVEQQTIPLQNSQNENLSVLQLSIDQDIGNELEIVSLSAPEMIMQLAINDELDIQPKMEVEPVAEPQMEVEPVAEPQMEVEPVAEPQMEVEPVVEPQMEVEPVAEPQMEVEPVAEPQIEVEPVAEPQMEVEPVVEPQIEVEFSIEPHISLIPLIISTDDQPIPDAEFLQRSSPQSIPSILNDFSNVSDRKSTISQIPLSSNNSIVQDDFK